MTSTWVVVLNWNGCDDTLELVDQLTPMDLNVIVVDNGSYDGTLEAVTAKHPLVHTIQTGANLGYSGGNNAGITYALKAGADVVGVLNNDTLVEDGFHKPLVELAMSGVAVSPDIRYAAEPDKSWCRGSVLNEREGWYVYLVAGDQPAPDSGPTPTPVLSGCCIFASAGTWRKVGLFDDRLFLIFEDFDWSRRAQAMGVELLVETSSRIEHKVSRSFRGSNVGSYYYARNGLIFAARHLGTRLAARFLVKRVLRPSARALLHRDWKDAAMLLIGASAALFGKRGHTGTIACTVAK